MTSWLTKIVALMLIALALAACSGQSNVPTQQVPGGDPTRGQGALLGYGCETCHQIPGVSGTDASVGPPLTRFAARHYIAGELPNTSENLVRWIMDPQSVEPGTAMPNMKVSESAARDIAAFLYTLK